MRQAVAAALERLATRIEFNDGFELDLIMPETWLAERHARAVIEDWRRDDVEIVELRISVEGDVLEPSQRLADALERRAGRRVLVLHTIDDDVDVARWQPVFRRLNENRNGIVREFVGNLVLLLAPRLVQSFAAEAPDMWSIGTTLVVGTRTREQLLEAMLEHMHALLRLTRETRAEAVTRAQAIAPEWVGVLSESSASLRARQLFELLLEHDQAQFTEADVPAPIEPHRITAQRTPARRLRWRLGSLSLLPERWTSDRGAEALAHLRATLVTLQDLEQVIDIGQSMASADSRIATVGSVSPDDPRLACLRCCVDLVFVAQSNIAWRVVPGDAHVAPVIDMGRSETTIIELEARNVARATFRLSYSSFHLPEQLWLPGIDPEDLGSAPLYRQPHH